MKKLYITEDERNLIASTPPNECWLCNLLSNNIRKDKEGIFFSEIIFVDDGIIEHLHQIIKREFIFNT